MAGYQNYNANNYHESNGHDQADNYAQYNANMARHGHSMSATFVPGGFDDDYYYPSPTPELRAPEPQRINPEMSNNIQQGLQNMSLAELDGRSSVASPPLASPGFGNQQPQQQQSGHSHDYHQYGGSNNDAPHLSPFPKLHNPPPNIPSSDEELEATLENARTLVLNSNDPEMQLAWAADALVYVGVCADDAEREAQTHPNRGRPATPRIEHQLKTDAMNITTFLADQHHPKAEFLRGMWLEWGRFGQREDKKEAFRCYSRAADRGYARAEYRIGMLYESYNDPVKALRHYHRGVDAGDAASCYRLGMMTLRGQHGQPQDYRRALELIKQSAQAADENAAQGAYVYGMLLARQLPQITVPDDLLAYDERAARINIEKAAYLKFAKAQLKMGSAYELGSLGCEFSPALSMHYNALASRQGEAEADMALSKWFLVGSEGLFPKNEELAYTYAERAAQSGLATAEFALGYFNEIGMYVKVDLERAQDWYQKAAKHGNDDAKARIEGLQNKQILNKRDHEKVAIKRITSQYGSQRGARPERFQQQRQQAPSRLGQSTSIDEVAAGYANGHAAGAVQAPSRGSSITPYPIDDRPPTVAPNDRPGSVAPYPLEDGPPKQQRLGPAGGFFNVQQPPQAQPMQRPATTIGNIPQLPEIRPSSAFQLNPDLRSNSAASVPQLPSQQPGYGGVRPGYLGGQAPPRPATALPGASGVHPADPRARLGAGQRVASGPAGMQQYQQSGPSPSPRPGMPPQVNSAATVPIQPTQQPPKIDIGFSAPFDGRQRTYGPGGTGAIGGRAPQSPVLKTTDSMPNFNNPAAATSGRVSAPGSRANSRPPEGRTPRPSESGLSGGGAPRPPAKDSFPPGGGTPKPNAPTSSGAQAKPASKPPGKGPKTFEEMGVPSHKQDSECVLM